MRPNSLLHYELLIFRLECKEAGEGNPLEMETMVWFAVAQTVGN